MTGDDLIIAAPWLVFAAGLAVIGWRLAVGRGRRRRRRGPRKPGVRARPGQDRIVARAAPPGERPGGPGCS